jgi:hypothetical protein
LQRAEVFGQTAALAFAFCFDGFNLMLGFPGDMQSRMAEVSSILNNLPQAVPARERRNFIASYREWRHFADCTRRASQSKAR